MSRLIDFFAPYLKSIKSNLLPLLVEEPCPLTEKQHLVQTLEVIRVELHTPVIG